MYVALLQLGLHNWLFQHVGIELLLVSSQVSPWIGVNGDLIKKHNSKDLNATPFDILHIPIVVICHYNSRGRTYILPNPHYELRRSNKNKQIGSLKIIL